MHWNGDKPTLSDAGELEGSDKQSEGWAGVETKAWLVQYQHRRRYSWWCTGDSGNYRPGWPV